MSRHTGRVRVMTWNIHGGVGPDRRCDLARVAKLVKRHDPDVLALQEVDSRRRVMERHGAFEYLAGALGHHVEESRLINAPDGDYGHVVISRWPLRATEKHDVSVSGREPRAAIETTVETPFGDLHVVAVHLGLSFHERRHQARLLQALALRGPPQTVLMGDFNDWLWRGSVQKAVAALLPMRSRFRTFPANCPLFALDRIYCRPASMMLRSWTDRDARHASDHLPAIADLEVGEA